MITATDLFNIPMPPPIRPEPKRNQWGHYLLHDPRNGKETAFVRVSTLKEQMADQYGLTRWKMRMAATGLVYESQAPDEALGGRARVMDRMARLLDEEDDMNPSQFKKQMNDLVEEAFVIGGGTLAADSGTAFHAWAEYADLGLCEVEDIPGVFRPFYVAYREALADAGIIIRPEFIEKIVVNLAYGVAGTLDRIFELADGQLVIGDLKSGSDIRLGWREHVQQFAAYQTSEFMLDDDTDEWVPMVDVSAEVAVLVHVPIMADAPAAHLIPLPLAKGRTMLDHSKTVYDFRKEKDPGQVDLPTRDGILSAAINAAQTREDLDSLYEANKDAWTPRHDMLGTRRLAKLGL